MKSYPDIPTILSHRREKSRKANRSASHRLVQGALGLGVVVSALVGLALLLGAWGYADITRDLPSIQRLPQLLNPENGLLLQPTRLFDRSGQNLLLTLSPTEGKRDYAAYADLPVDLVNATLVLADPEFWRHAGFLIEGWHNPQSHPTLAQSLAYNLLLFDEPATLRRSIRERILAAEITAQFGRKKVLEWYLNSALFGHQVVGISQSAQFYFNSPVKELDLPQSALLAAISQAPALNPIDTPQAADKRLLVTLQVLQAFNLVEADRVDAAIQHPPVITASQSTTDPQAHSFIDLALDQLGQVIPTDRILRGGLIIRTSMDFDLQGQVQCALDDQLTRLGVAGLQPVAECPGRTSLDLQATDPIQQPTAGVMVLEPQTGQVLAYAGYGMGSHPIGTLLDPFIYLTGFSRGMSPASLGWDIPASQAQVARRYLGPVSFRTALANDLPGPVSQIEALLGIRSIQENLETLGMDASPADIQSREVPVTLLSVAKPYSVLANLGIAAGQEVTAGSIQPFSVLGVEEVDGRVWGDWSFPQKQALVSPSLAFMLVDVLKDRHAQRADILPIGLADFGDPVGFKSGQTPDGSGTWSVGFTDTRLAVTWVGGQPPLPASLSSRSSTWLINTIFPASLQGSNPHGWQPPADLVRLAVCDPSGMLPTLACPNIVNDLFLSGNQPVQPDTLYELLDVNRETNLLATVYTPPELVDQRLYLNIPPFAQDWAESAGISLIPSEYDTILKPSPLPYVHITSPSFFADLNGIVFLVGSASGEGFSTYRLEYGFGLFPKNWFQIGEDQTSPVNEGVLAEWDTTGLNGLVAVRLLVVHDDKTMDVAVTQFMLDNQAPDIRITSPQEGQIFSLAKETGVVFMAEVADSALAEVRLLVDGTLVQAFSQGPFNLVWASTPGKHTLRVEAVDRAGNSASQEIRFSVNP